MALCARSSNTVRISSGSEAAAASSGFGGYWNRLQILVVMVWKPAGSARIAGERNGDAPRRHPGAAAEHRRGIFQLPRSPIERVGHQHEHIGECVAGDDED